ncbi:MAG: cyclic nucleotide-binding domain-containing protein [Candidatus Riflebacteria bacterium]|nr:cyclic nucleotide-binding domain-containing protein [Candidatus Riflebacteria bacterium]
MEVIQGFKESLQDPEKREQILLYMGQVSIFTGMTQQQLLTLARHCEARSYGPQEKIFVQDEPGHDLHIVLEGKVYLIRRLPSGEAKLITTKEQGTSFGEVGFVTKAGRNLSAVAGHSGTLQLVLTRDEFDRIIAQEPQIGFSLFKDLLDTVTRRMEWLPPFFRNYLLWGYKPPESTEEEKQAEVTVAKTPLLAGAGGAAGLLGGVLFGVIVPHFQPALAGQTQPVMISSAVALAIAGAVVGGGIGGYLEKVEDEVKFGRKHHRSCINCKFVVWNEANGTSDCFYRVEKLFQVTFRPGRSFDSYTDCPSFDPLGSDEKVKAQRRDTIGKD